MGLFTQITETSSRWQQIQRRHHWLCIQHFGRLSPKLVLGPENFCLNWSKLWVYVVPGSVCEEHIDDVSQFVTNTSRTQLFHDAAPDGKAVEEGTAKLGPTLSCKSTLLANDKSLGKLSVGHIGDEGVPITRSQLIKEGNFMAARALDFLVCGAINEPRLLADGPVSNHFFFCVRCDQRALATRKHELWDCPGNRLINHTHERIKPPCDTGTGIFGHTTSFVWPWSFAV